MFHAVVFPYTYCRCSWVVPSFMYLHMLIYPCVVTSSNKLHTFAHAIVFGILCVAHILHAFAQAYKPLHWHKFHDFTCSYVLSLWHLRITCTHLHMHFSLQYDYQMGFTHLYMLMSSNKLHALHSHTILSLQYNYQTCCTHLHMHRCLCIVTSFMHLHTHTSWHELDTLHMSLHCDNTLYTFIHSHRCNVTIKRVAHIFPHIFLNCNITKGVSHISTHAYICIVASSNQFHTFVHAHMSLHCNITKRATHYRTHICPCIVATSNKFHHHVHTSSHDYSSSPASVSDWFMLG